MTTNLVIHRDPFRPHLNVDNEEIEPGSNIEKLLSEKGLCLYDDSGMMRRNGAFVVLINGEVRLAKDWDYELLEGDCMQVALLPKGGGGGGGSSIGNILAAVIIAVAAYFTMGLSLAAAAAVGVGALAVLSLAGGVLPNPSSPTGTSGVGAASPTYSLDAQGNSARLLQAIPRVYGRVKMYPDLASQPYVDYHGNEQYLYQLFCISVGNIEVESIWVDETEIDTFVDATYQIVNPGQAVTLFPDNVVTSDAVQSLEMYAPNNPSFSILGPYIAAPSGTLTNRIAVDVALPRGAGRLNQTTGNTENWTISVFFEYQAVDDLGNPVGLWNSLAFKTFTFATQDAQIISIEASVPLGRYRVRGQRYTAETTDNQTFGSVQWLSLKSYLQSTHVYGNVTLLAVKMKASSVLNSTTARKFSVIAKGLVQKWDPVNGWGALQYSANPIWIGSDILRDTDYGRGLPTARLNMSNFYRLAQIYETRGDTFNGVFDNTTQLWAALIQVCRVGRAVPVYYAGVIDIIRDEPATLPTQVFTPSKMVSGTFKTTYNYFDVDTPDHVIIEYVDDVTWETAQVSCILPGSTALNPSTVKFFGITNRDQAWREGISMAAANRDRRKSISFQALSPGLIPQYNGLVRVQHDVPQWGYSGRVLSFDKVTGEIQVSEPIELDVSVTNLIAFRSRNGMENGPFTLIADPDSEEFDYENGIFRYIVVGNPTQLNSIYISDGVREDYTIFTAGPSTRRGQLALVSAATPSQDGKVNLAMINYADSVHSAENGGVVPPPDPESLLPGIPVAPIVSTVTVVYTVTVGEQNIVASPANGAIYYEFRAKFSGSTDWQNLGTNSDPTLVTHLNAGDWSVQVRGVGRAEGPWATWNGTILATSLPVPTLDVFATSSDLFSIGLSWAYTASTSSIAGYVEIWVSITDVLGNANRLVALPYPANKYIMTDLAPGDTRYFWARVIDKAGRIGPWYNNGVSLSNSASFTKAQTYLEGQIGESQLTQFLSDKIDSGAGAVASIEQIESELGAGIGIRAQATRPDGRIVTAGMAIGVTPQGGELVSEAIFAVDRFAIVDPASLNGAINAPFIVSGGVVYMKTAFIQDATITNAKIANATITNAKIADATIITAKIADANITTAKIANLAVTTGKIANLAVDTLQIAGRAVTFPISAYTDAAVTRPATTTLTYYSMQSVTFTGSGYEATINYTCQYGSQRADSRWRLMIDGVAVASGLLGNNTQAAATYRTTLAVTFQTVVSGSLTIDFQMAPPVNADSTNYRLVVSNRALTVIETMR